MLTSLGKQFRIIRLNNGELLKTMAEKLNVTPAYLSSIENGKRKPTQKFMKSLFDSYSFSEEVKRKIEDAYYTTIDNISIDLSNQSPEQKDLGLVFARKFDTLTDEEVKKIFKLLNKGE